MLLYATWAVAALALHYLSFASGAALNGRGRALDALRENLRLYHPLDWTCCVRARMANLRTFITCEKHGVQHDTLGTIFPRDLNDPAKQDRIAREAFISRTQFWAGAAFNFARALLVTGALGYLALRVTGF